MSQVKCKLLYQNFLIRTSVRNVLTESSLAEVLQTGNFVLCTTSVFR